MDRAHVPPRHRTRGIGAYGRARASELIEDCLSRVEALEPQLGAFTHVDAEGARRRRARSARRPTAVRRGADRDQGQPPGGRSAVDQRQRSLRRLRGRSRRALRPPAARRRVRDRRQDGAARDAAILPTTRAARTGHPQPVGPRPHPRRLQRRLGGRGGGRHGADRPRQRRRRLDPHPGRLLRPGRPEAARGRVSIAPDAGTASWSATGC